MPRSSWSRLLSGYPWFRAPGAYPIAAYSEFQGPPLLGPLPYETHRTGPRPDDEWHWCVTEYEEAHELRPGLEQVAAQVIPPLVRLARGETVHGLARSTVENNPYWPAELAAAARKRTDERYVTLMPLALSRTQDALGRLRWTLFGASEHGPAHAFWQSFARAGDSATAENPALEFLHNLLIDAFDETSEAVAGLRRGGLRIMPQGRLAPPLPDWGEDPLPKWTRNFCLGDEESLDGVRYILTFRPYSMLPARVRHAYASGRLHLLPYPGSLLYWGAPQFLELRHTLPAAIQVPLLWHVERHAGANGLRVPQSGWMHEPTAGGDRKARTQHTPLRNTYRRAHRYTRAARDAPAEQTVSPREDRMAHVLFDASEAIGLYGKPMARNAQLWTEEGRLLLDGPRATHEAIERAAEAVEMGGLFGYRFLFPAMRVGRHEVVWHRPLVAYVPPGRDRPAVIFRAPLGVLSARHTSRPHAAPVALWPDLVARPPHVAAATLFAGVSEPRPHQTARNCRKLLDAHDALGGAPLPRSFARRLLNLPEKESLEEWLESLPARAADAKDGRALAEDLSDCLAPASAAASAHVPASCTFHQTARRPFETAFWNAIAALSTGRFPNRNNADCARDAATRRALGQRGGERDLDRLGDYLLARHSRAIASAGMQGHALVGEIPFHWRTDFAYTWSEGWLRNQGTAPRERELIVVIPGRDRSRAVIMADHYDTAYMEDRYREHGRRNGPRLAAPGADDNGSATATLLMAAPCLLSLSRAGRLEYDVWLVHLTGEEFPADCLGARHLVQRLVERTLAVQLRDGRSVDLSHVVVTGAFILDMVAHDNPHRRGLFQIAPGDSNESYKLALTAHLANEAWNAQVGCWNQHPARRVRTNARARNRNRDRDRGRRGQGRAGAPTGPPPIAPHRPLFGEVRPHDDPRSTLYNTDAQIFSDAGIPVVLFMEDYEINRSGYHDSRDTLGGIDLDFGAALAAIAIETVARTAGVIYEESPKKPVRSGAFGDLSL